MPIYTTIRKKKKLTKLSKKIQRLVRLHKKVKLEVHYGSTTTNSNMKKNIYGMRYLRLDGDCQIHYSDQDNEITGKGKQRCCFFEEYAIYRNENDEEKVVKSLSDTLRAMQDHDSRHYKIKFIYANGRKIEV